MLSLKTWLRSLRRSLVAPKAARRRQSRRVEKLESRLLLAARTWDGGGANDLWSTAANWDGDNPLNPGDDVTMAGGARITNTHDLNFALNSIFFLGNNFVINGTTPIQLNGGAGGFAIDVFTITATINADVVIHNDTMIRSRAALSTLNMNGVISAGNAGVDLTLDFSTVFGGSVQNYRNLGTDANPFASITSQGIHANFANIVQFGTSTIAATVVTSDDQTWNTNATRLAGDTTFRTTTANGDITFIAPVDSSLATTADFRSLTTQTDGIVDFQGIVGGVNNLNTVLTEGFSSTDAGTTRISANITTQSILRNLVELQGRQTYSNSVDINGTRTLTNTEVAARRAGDIEFLFNVDGDNLIVNTSGKTVFIGNVGTIDPLDSLVTDFFPRLNEATQISSPIFNVDTATFNDPVEIFGSGGGTPLIEGFNSLPQVGGIPPDPTNAAGPQHIVTMVNFAIAIHDKATGNIIAQTSLRSFWNEPTRFLFDPWIIFDPHSNRFFAMVVDVDDPTETSNIYIAVSNDSTPTNLTSDWFRYTIPRAGIHQSLGSATFPDYEKMGVSEDAIVITGNDFGINVGGFSHVSIFAIEKAPLLTGGAVNILFDTTLTGGRFSVHPVINYDDNDGTLYFVESVQFFGGNQVRLYALENVLGVPTLTSTLVTVPQFFAPLDVPQQGGPPIDSGDTRFMSGVVRDGHLWTAHAIRDPNVDNETVVRWYEFDVSGLTGGSATLVQSGNVDPGVDLHTWFPHINVDVDGDMGIGFAIGGPNDFAGIGFTGRLASDPSGTTRPVTIAQVGLGPYAQFDTIGRNRWGDYTGLALDPDGRTFWLYNEFANVGNAWQTFVGSFEIEPILAPAVTSVVMTVTNDIFFNSGIFSSNSAFGNLTITAPEIFLGDGTPTTIGTPPGNVRTIQDYIGVHPYFLSQNSALGTLSLTGDIFVNIANSDTLLPSIRTNSGQTYNGDVFLQDFTVIESNGLTDVPADAIRFNASLTGQGLQINTHADTFFGDGDAGDFISLQSLNQDQPEAGFNGGRTFFNITSNGFEAGGSLGTDVLTIGSQTYRDAVFLTSSIQFQSLSTFGGDLAFVSTIDSDSALATPALQSAVFLTAAVTQFFDDIGVTRRLNTLQTDAPGNTQFRDNDTLDPSNDIDVFTQNFQDYGDIVQLDLIVNMTNTTGRLAFQSRIDSLTAANRGGLHLSGGGPIAIGDGTGNDYVGDIFRLATFTTAGAGVVQFNIRNSTVNTPSVFTDGEQRYDTRVQLVLNTVLMAANAGGPADITFAREIDNFSAGARKLSVNAGGATTFQGRVGSLAAPITELFTDEPGYTGAGGVTRFDVQNSSAAVPTVHTIGLQRYGDAVVLSADTVLRSRDAGHIEFHSRVDAFTGPSTGSDLRVLTQGNTDFGDGLAEDHVGSLAPLQSITTDLGGATRFNITNSGHPGESRPVSIRTTGAQSYLDQVILQQYTTLDSPAPFTFGSRITGTPLLTIDLPLSGPWFEVSAVTSPVKIIQDGTKVFFIDRLGNQQTGTVNNATSPTSGSVTGLGSFTVNGDVITFANGTRWERSRLGGYYVIGGKLTTVQQNGAVLVFTNENGHSVPGRFTTHTQADIDVWNLTATLASGNIRFSNGSVWSPFVLSPTYTINGRQTRVIFNGLNITLVNENGDTSPATLLSPTLIRANKWNITGQIVQGQIRWSNGSAWNKNLTITGTNQFGQPVRLTMTNNTYQAFGPNNTSSNVRALSKTSLTAFNTNGTISGNRILFGNGQVWTFSQRDINALYGDIQRFPFPS